MKSPILLAIGLSLVGVIGDYLFKLASEKSHPILNAQFWIGFVVYSSTAFGWVYVMRSMNLAHVGVVYGVSTVLFLTLAGLMHGERISATEGLGIAMAVGSILLLRRFS
jgi:small multidrug resistance pump